MSVESIEKWYLDQINWVNEDTRFGIKVGDKFLSMLGAHYSLPKILVCHDGKIFSDADTEYLGLMNKNNLTICVMTEFFSECSGIWIMRRHKWQKDSSYGIPDTYLHCCCVHIDESLAYEDMFDDLFLQKDWTPILNERLYHRFSSDDCVVFQTHYVKEIV